MLCAAAVNQLLTMTPPVKTATSLFTKCAKAVSPQRTSAENPVRGVTSAA
jgi:hypothetical protein